MTNEELLTVLDARFQRLETDVRRTYVQVESLHDETRRIAESVILVDEKLERFRTTTEGHFDEIDRRFEVMDGRFA
ncbi:MAG TPA: hypothetical protein VII32_10950, partial [Thermoanaerobaculia bacterium]